MKNRTMRLAVLCVISLFLLNGHASAQALGGDTQWATIGAVGNRGLDRTEPVWWWPQDNLGRGAVNYEYRIAKHEVTTGQWMEFLNAVNGTREDGTSFSRPIIFGAWDDLSYTGPGNRFVLRPDAGPNAARLPVGGIQWRDAARYVNWLHNGKQSDSASLASGAYDTSTFGFEADGRTFTDQNSRSDGAKFWIPSLDEWLKAGYYDPSKLNEDGSKGGWWLRPDGSDTDLVYGMPTEDGAQSSGGLRFDFDEVLPVGSYDSTTPWGLFDVSGSMFEWNETVFVDEGKTNARYVGGSSSGSNEVVFSDSPLNRQISRITGSSWFGLRIASVPAPGVGSVIVVGGVLLLVSRRRNG